MKKISLILLLLLISLVNSDAQTTKEELFDNLNKTGGVYYAYPEKEIKSYTPAPKKYDPFYASHFGRHGSRYLLGDNDYKKLIDLLEDARKNNAITPKGIELQKRLSIVWKEVADRDGDLSPLGVRQQRGIAERMFKAYPRIFENNNQLWARSTLSVRCVLTMAAFCERLKELNPDLQITREASAKYLNTLNYQTEEAKAYRTAEDTWKKGHEDFETEHIKPQRLVSSLFSDTTFISMKVDGGSLMWAMYWIASDMQDIETDLSFYDFFEKEELFDIWQCFNYRWYVNNANAAQNNGIMFGNAKPLLKNMLESAKDAIEAKSNGASFRFAHDGNIIPLAMLLHLQDTYNSVSEPSEFYKVWSDFKVAPMAANIQIIFFRNQKDSNDIIVKFLLNEKETLVPPIKTDIAPYYHWKDVDAYYQTLLAE